MSREKFRFLFFFQKYLLIRFYFSMFVAGFENHSQPISLLNLTKLIIIKKLVLSVTAGIMLCAAGFTAYKVHEHKTMTPQEILVMKNLDALSRGEFEFGGQMWDDDWHWYNIAGSDWKPVLQWCESDLYIPGEPYHGFFGSKVVCETGNGNCFDGTDCLKN